MDKSKRVSEALGVDCLGVMFSCSVCDHAPDRYWIPEFLDKLLYRFTNLLKASAGNL